MIPILWFALALVAASLASAGLTTLILRGRHQLQLAQLREQLAGLAPLQEQREELRLRLQALEQQQGGWLADKARLEERLAAEQAKQAFSEQSRAQLRQEFENLSAKILEQRGKQLGQAHQQGLEGLLQPFREQLQDFRRRVDQIHGDDNRAQAALLEQLNQLKQLNQQMHKDARNLTDALKGQAKVQGNWGEMILERVLESSGLTKGREYQTQVTLKSEEGQRRLPDAIVHLPEGKDVVIDAKVSLVAYERMVSAEDGAIREQAATDHLTSLRNHIRGLDGKDYSGLPGIRSLDFVLLFIPVEGAFMAAMEREPGLYSEAFERNIVLVSPTTLLVTLRTIQNIWRYEYQNSNALDIADRAGKICDQVSLVAESLDEVGDRLDKAQQAWQSSYSRLSRGRGNLLGQAHKLQALGAKARRALPPAQDDE